MTAPPQRVLMTADAVGGVWTYCLDLARGISGLGAHVALAALGPSPSAEQKRQIEEILSGRFVDTGLPLEWTQDDPGEIGRTARGIAALAREYSVDLVHLNSPIFAAEGSFDVPVIGFCHSCLATWWLAAGFGELPCTFARKRNVYRSGLEACHMLVAPSHSFAKATATAHGIEPVVVYNGRAQGFRVHDPRIKQAHVLTSGRLWDAGKNLRALDLAAGRMRSPVYAAGPASGPNGETVTFGTVVHLGRLDEKALSAHLNRAAVFASLSLYEPFGLGVLEAAQAGCALVLSDIPTFRELWEGAAIFVQPSQSVEVATVLEELLNDRDRFTHLGSLAAARARRFTPRAMLDETLAIYSIAQRHRRAKGGVAA